MKENALSEKSRLESMEVQIKNAGVSLLLPCEHLVSPTSRRNQLLVVLFKFKPSKVLYKSK